MEDCNDISKKVYKLSDMLCAWLRDNDGAIFKCSTLFETTQKARERLLPFEYEFVAITPADAVEFYEGEGLDEENL